MTKHNEITCIFFYLSVCSFGVIALFHNHDANAAIPIPKKRPAILNVSPAYIEELRNREKPKILKNTLPEKIENTKATKIQKTQKKNIIDHDTKSEVIDIDSASLLNVLDGSKPTPLPASTTILGEIEPSANNEEENNSGNDNKTTLVSFFLEPTETSLNEDLENFLKSHAVKLFNENKNLKNGHPCLRNTNRRKR